MSCFLITSEADGLTVCPEKVTGWQWQQASMQQGNQSNAASQAPGGLGQCICKPCVGHEHFLSFEKLIQKERQIIGKLQRYN